MQSVEKDRLVTMHTSNATAVVLNLACRNAMTAYENFVRTIPCSRVQGKVRLSLLGFVLTRERPLNAGGVFMRTIL